MILIDELDQKCKKVLNDDKNAIKKWRQKSKEIEVRRLRNIKRRNNRLKNKIKPQGHQYANEEGEKKRYDPTREVALKRLPGISNYLTANCFINSFLQLFRHTNIKKNLSFGKNSSIYNFMNKEQEKIPKRMFASLIQQLIKE